MQILQCFLCSEIFAEGSMKLAKLKEHLTSIHLKIHQIMRDVVCEKMVQFEKAGILPKLGFAPTQKPSLDTRLFIALPSQRNHIWFEIPWWSHVARKWLRCLVAQTRERKWSSFQIMPSASELLSFLLISWGLWKNLQLFSMQSDETVDISQCSHQRKILVMCAHFWKIERL